MLEKWTTWFELENYSIHGLQLEILFPATGHVFIFLLSLILHSAYSKDFQEPALHDSWELDICRIVAAIVF